MPLEFKQNISKVVSEHLCNTCGACFAVCKKNAITYQETVGGYFFPNIDEKICVNCGTCYKVCPGIHLNKSLADQMPENPFAGNILSCHVGTALDQDIFSNSQSGGIVTALLVHLLDTRKISGAIVAIMQSGTPPRGKAIFARNRDELLSGQKSKYVPIPMLSIIPQLQNIKGSVAFVGLPCHMHGLNHIFDLYPKLKSKIQIKVGLVCDRVLTNAAVDFLGKQGTIHTVTNFIFRDKLSPNYPGNVVVMDESGGKKVLDASLRMNIKDFFTPVRCRLCFDKLNIFSDITLGDPHELKGIDRIKGETMIITRTGAGQKILNDALHAGLISIRPQKWQNVIIGQHIDEKKVEWLSYSKAWKSLRKQVPGYYSLINKRLSLEPNNSKTYLQGILYSLRLDDFNSREELLHHVDNLLKRKNRISRALFPLRLAKRVVRTFIRTIEHLLNNDERDQNGD